MDAGFTAEQDEIRRTLRELLHKRCGPDELRAAVEGPVGHDPALWTALAEQLGLPALALPEAYGGVGCTSTEIALAVEELGRLLVPSPLLATAVLTAPLILALGTDDQRAELLPRLADGSLTATLAAPAACLALTGDNGGDWAGGGRAGGVQARRAAGGWRLYGEVERVLDGHSAGLLLVAAHTGGFARSRTDLFLVPGDADGLVRVRQTALDSTRPLARLQLRDVAARLLGEEGSAVLPALARLGDTVAAVLACETVGAADRVLELTVEYVKQREQFGRPIGSFQAVKHRLADVYVQLQTARSAAYYAAWSSGHREVAGAAARREAAGVAAGQGGAGASSRGAPADVAVHREVAGAAARREAVGVAAGQGGAGASSRGAPADVAVHREAAGAAARREAVGVAAGQGGASAPGHGKAADVTVHHEAAQLTAQAEAVPPTVHHDAAHPVGGLALAQALEALRAAAGEAIQSHGGVGFTWECDVHLYFKRAAGDELLFGPVHRLRAHAADAARLFEAREVTV